MIRQLRLTNFRNFSEQAFEDLNETVVISGPNGAGKTNVLEAIALLSGSGWHRYHKLGEVIRWDEKFAAIEAAVSFKNEELTTVRAVVQNNRLQYLHNQKPTLISRVRSMVPVVIFSPDDVGLLRQDPAQRRKFLDQLLLQISPEYTEALSMYNRVLKQRNAALRLGQHNQLFVWEDELARHGAVITLARNWLLIDLSTKFELEGTLEYLPSPRKLIPLLPASGSLRENLQEKAGIVREFLREKWEDLREKEKVVGFTLMGPQRDDWEARVTFTKKKQNNIDTMELDESIRVGIYASRGQQRVTVIHLQLAALAVLQGYLEKKPIWLLDDVFSELDLPHQQLVYRACQTYQVFLTTTNIDYMGVKRLLAQPTTSHLALFR